MQCFFTVAEGKQVTTLRHTETIIRDTSADVGLIVYLYHLLLNFKEINCE